MFNAMLTRSRNKKGFTLMEMLIVVAIIGILVAVSFPVFSSQLTAAKAATDQANVRAAKAVAMASYLTETGVNSGYFDAAKGTIVATTETGIKGYGQGTTSAADTGAENDCTKGDILKVEVSPAGVFTATWEAAV